MYTLCIATAPAANLSPKRSTRKVESQVKPPPLNVDEGGKADYVVCPLRCGQVVRKRDFLKHRETECGQRMTECPLEGCDEVSSYGKDGTVETSTTSLWKVIVSKSWPTRAFF